MTGEAVNEGGGGERRDAAMQGIGKRAIAVVKRKTIYVPTAFWQANRLEEEGGAILIRPLMEDFSYFDLVRRTAILSKPREYER